jgi:phosphohistidine phosphatase
MKLYFVRHAAAIAREGEVADEHRYLTLRGRKSFRLTAKRMAKKGNMPDAIITSPLVRAVQTADILSEALAFRGKLVASPELAAGFNVAKLRRVLASFKGTDMLVLVGHEPDLGVVVGTLLDLGRPLPLKKGMVVCLEMPSVKQKARASLKWILFEGKKVDVSALVTDRENNPKRL